jgi:hypothetical protein
MPTIQCRPLFERAPGGKIAIGDQITRVQEVFKGIFNLEPQFRMMARNLIDCWQMKKKVYDRRISRPLNIPNHLI